MTLVCHGSNRHHNDPYPIPPPIRSIADTDADSEEMLQDADEEAEGELAPGKQTMRVVFQPTFGGYHPMFYLWYFVEACHRHYPHNILSWPLAACASFQED